MVCPIGQELKSSFRENENKRASLQQVTSEQAHARTHTQLDKTPSNVLHWTKLQTLHITSERVRNQVHAKPFSMQEKVSYQSKKLSKCLPFFLSAFMYLHSVAFEEL